MSKLAILIPQYNEDNDIIKPLLDSIEIQQNINFKDIEVIIGNDGSDTKLSIDFLKTYSFPIQYHYFEHARLAGTRKKLFDITTSDYVMFCDADDKFISTIALNIILQEIDKGFDALICDFMEEHIKENGTIVYIPKTNNSIFVHGKIYSRKFLLDNKIEWHEELHEHQDSAFNILARICANDVRLVNIPLYLWHDNPNSISRKNKKYHLPNTWCAMIDSYNALINDLKDRGYGKQACYYAKYCLYATYYELGHKIWYQEDTIERKNKVLSYLAQFYYRHELLIKNCDKKRTEEMDEIAKKHAMRRGELIEMPLFEDWLNSLITLFKER